MSDKINVIAKYELCFDYSINENTGKMKKAITNFGKMA